MAELGGEVVGLVHWQNDFVHALHVRASHARHGVGAALMDLAEAEIAAAGLRGGDARDRGHLQPAQPDAFYAARGYQDSAAISGHGVGRQRPDNASCW